MKRKSYMTISEFARVTGMKRANLIFYDNIGLLSPEFRGENDYRCYTRQQLGSAYLITVLRELGLGLSDIRQYAQKRTPDNLLVLLAQQETHIQQEINRLKRIREMLGLYMDMATEGLGWNTDEVILRQQKKEPIFLGHPTKPEHNDDESSIIFYREAADQGMDLGYPLGSVIAKDLLLEEIQAKEQEERGGPCLENTNFVDRYYFKVKQGHNTYKPQGLYAVTCGLCGYGQSEFLYKRLARYIKEKGLEICGDTYEEYPLNEMAVQDENQYLTKVEVLVKYKEAGQNQLEE